MQTKTNSLKSLDYEAGQHKEMSDVSAQSDYFRVVSSSGHAFYTRAVSASQYVLDPVFIQFILLSIALYSSLMLAMDIPIAAQFILSGAGVVATFFSLALVITIYIAVAFSFGLKTIYTPILLIPMQLLNTVFFEYILHLFEQNTADSFNSMWEIALRTFIIIICLDIFRAKFVAPLHSLYIPTEQFEDETARVGSTSSPVAAPMAAPESAPAVEHVSTTAKPQVALDPKIEDAANAVRSVLKVGSKSFDINTLQFIRSEDHYLVVQHGDQSTMVRGKLRDIEAQIGVSYGVQVNRSAWVAYSAIASINEPSNGTLEILLKDDTVARVSKARRVFFTHSYEQYLANLI